MNQTAQKYFRKICSSSCREPSSLPSITYCGSTFLNKFCYKGQAKSHNNPLNENKIIKWCSPLTLWGRCIKIRLNPICPQTARVLPQYNPSILGHLKNETHRLQVEKHLYDLYAIIKQVISEQKGKHQPKSVVRIK